MEKKKSYGKWILLIITIGFFAGIYFFSVPKFFLVLNYFTKLLLQIIPILFLVYILMVLINYFITKEILQKQMTDKSSFKKWVMSIVFGIISVGPLYIWYPLMKDLKEKGVEDKFIATFLYNRGIKPQWAPMLILYFGWTYTFVLFFVMTIFSIPQGIITQKLVKLGK